MTGRLLRGAVRLCPRQSDLVKQQPNMRLKLAAPLLTESGERSACGVVEFHL